MSSKISLLIFLSPVEGALISRDYRFRARTAGLGLLAREGFETFGAPPPSLAATARQAARPMFCHASVIASPSVSSSTKSNRTRVQPARPHAPFSGANTAE